MTCKINCLCEMMEQPVGIDCLNPRFSWSIEPAPEGAGQTAYRILVSGSKNMETPVWDSGMVRSPSDHLVAYSGTRLKSGTRYYYRISVLCGDALFVGETCSFVTGILEIRDWEPLWIACAGMADQAFYIRCPFRVKKAVRTAAAFVVSPNYYLLSLNGAPCGDLRLNNARTDYRKTLLYETYPLDLKEGENVLGIEIGNGWMNLEASERKVAKREYLAAFQIRIEYTDGAVEWVASGRENSYCSNICPVTRNHIYHGEEYDARRKQPGWNTPGFRMSRDAGWGHVYEADSPGGEIMAQMMEPIRITQILEPAAIYPLGEHSCTVDFGQNFAGWVRLRTRGPRGTAITLRYAELIHGDRTVNPCSLKGAVAADSFILEGEGEEEFEPRFTYHGFRYVQLDGLKKLPEARDLEGCVVRTDAKCIGSFHCSHELVNRFYKAMIWTEKSNQHSLPTDCPQRGERLGWLNDMTVRSDSALYNFRLPRLYQKWTRDIRDTQGKTSGAICDTAPFFFMGQKPADPVSSSYLLVPWNVYCHYGDIEILEENYEGCKRWTDYLKRHSEHYLVTYSQMGDWASPKRWCLPDSIGGGAVSAVTPPGLMATGYLYYDYIILQKMAEVLDKHQEAREFAQEAERVRQAFLSAYYDPAAHSFGQGSQACNAFPLYLGMVEETEKPYVLQNLITDIMVTNQGHLTTGNLGTRYVLEVLFQNGFPDEAFSLLTQTTYPSWGYMLENGATTLWERWEKIEDNTMMASYNHPMTGAAGVCLHKYLLGISPDETNPGFRNIIISPRIPTALDSASGQVETVHGIVECAWEKVRDRKFILKTRIPFNCTAEIYLPRIWPGDYELIVRPETAGRTKDPVRVTSGTYTFEMMRR